jgi:hypothetical protein
MIKGAAAYEEALWRGFLDEFRKHAKVDWMDKPQTGKWPARGELPKEIKIRGKTFTRSLGLNRHEQEGMYREDTPRWSRHLYVLPGRKRYVIDHRDEYNPHVSPVRHFLLDHMPEVLRPSKKATPRADG